MATTIFFDLGDTLGVPVLSADLRLQRLDPFDFVPPILRKLKAAGIRLGVISNTGDEPAARVNEVLKVAGLLEFFDPALLIYSHEAGLKKDSPKIFLHAAEKAGLKATPDQCMFVGEDAHERNHAAAARWRVCPHPLLVDEVLAGSPLRYLRISVPPNLTSSQWRAALRQFSLVPLHVSGGGATAVVALASERVAALLMNAQFAVAMLGQADLPLTTELYLLRDDKAKASGFMNTGGETAALFSRVETASAVLEAASGSVLVALSPKVPLESIHFEEARHGHTLRLMPDIHLLAEAPAAPAAFASAPGFGPLLSPQEAAPWSALSAKNISDLVERFSGQKPLHPGSNVLIRSRHVAHEHNKVAVQALAQELLALAPGRLNVRLHQFSHQSLTLHNVVAELAGQTSELILVTAHLDSVARPGDPKKDPAPGADDDMSGVAGVLAIAERFLALFPAATPPPLRTVQFVLFNDEENGLVGSQSYARQLRAAGADVAAVFQMDMIGFNKAEPRAWEVHYGFAASPDTETRSQALARLVHAAASCVSKNLPPPQFYGSPEGDPAEERSDHASFQQCGYAACVVSEDFFAGPDEHSPNPEPNPNYHGVGDTFIDADYAADLARAVGAAAWAATLSRVAPVTPSGFRKPANTNVMNRQIDTRKEGLNPFAKPLPMAAPALSSGFSANAVAFAAPAKSTLVEKALAYVQAESQAMGFAAETPAEFTPDPTVQRTSSGAAAVNLSQQYRGIPVFTMTRTVRFSADGGVLDAAGESAPLLPGLKTEPDLSAPEAVLRALNHLLQTDDSGPDEFGQETAPPALKADGYVPVVIASFNLPTRPTVLSKGPFEKPVSAHLIIFPHPEAPRLAWHIVVTLPDYSDQYVVVVSADDRGEILYCVSTMQRAVGKGSVFEFSPGLKKRAVVPFPRPLSDYPVMPSSPLSGFPAHWLESDQTLGNSTLATLGNSPTSLKGVLQGNVVAFEPADEKGDEQKMLNIFYFCNYMHDFLYILGFDEAAGNFQRTNFTHTGLGGDPVQARAHAGAVRGTANMSTFPDGTPPVMNMGLVTSTGNHTAMDADVVFHEYVHGLTNRVVGGRFNTGALDEPQSSGMGEGWSDYYALTIISYFIGKEKTVTGDWVVNNENGIRTAPYDDLYPVKFGGIGGFEDEHDVGEVWCAALMMMTRKIRLALGNDQDGYRLSWQIVTDGLKLTPANPSFLAGRDAILMALDELRKANKIPASTFRLVRRACWEAFAHFEMGLNASSNGASLHGVRGDTTVPSDL